MAPRGAFPRHRAKGCKGTWHTHTQRVYRMRERQRESLPLRREPYSLQWRTDLPKYGMWQVEKDLRPYLDYAGAGLNAFGDFPFFSLGHISLGRKI